MIEQLEAALAADFSFDNLQVYGDALQAAGDPRGHLIAIDLHIARHGSSADLQYRRRQWLREWLELSHAIDPTKGPWRAVTFAFGFVADLRAELASQVLKSPAGRYVRGLSLSHRMPLMSAVLHELGSAPRPWLERLTIVSRSRNVPPSSVWSTQPSMLDQAAIPAVIAATPRLRTLELAGNRMLRAFPHPHVSRLWIDGVDAFLPILEPGPEMPAVRELELALAHAPDAPVMMATPWPALAPPESLPSLTRLDLSEIELHTITNNHVTVFDVLTELGVRDQVEELRLWGILNRFEWEWFRSARLPRLRRLELEAQPEEWELPGVEIESVKARWPRPTYATDTVWITVPGYAPRQLPLFGLIRGCRHARSWLAPEAYEAWQTVWQTLEGMSQEGDGSGLSSTVLRRGLAGLGYLDASHRDMWPWARLQVELESLREECEVWVTMHQ